MLYLAEIFWEPTGMNVMGKLRMVLLLSCVVVPTVIAVEGRVV